MLIDLRVRHGRRNRRMCDNYDLIKSGLVARGKLQ